MSTTKVKGTTLAFAPLGSTTYAGAISEVRAIKSLGGLEFESYAAPDVSGAGTIIPQVATMAKGGMVSLTLAVTGTNMSSVLPAADGVDRSWMFTLSDAKTIKFDGPLLKFNIVGGAENSEVLVDVDIQQNTLFVYA